MDPPGKTEKPSFLPTETPKRSGNLTSLLFSGPLKTPNTLYSIHKSKPLLKPRPQNQFAPPLYYLNL